jgi:hypothetical protein
MFNFGTFADSFVPDAQSKWGTAPSDVINSVGEAPGSTNNDLATWLGRAADVYSAVKGSKKLDTPNNAPDVPTRNSQIAGSATARYMPWILGGIALLAVVFFLRR